MESSNKLKHHRRTCAFGCIPLPGPYHRFPHPKNQPDRFIEWINIVCDNLAPENPYILKLVNEDPEKIYNNKSVCDYHFKKEDMTAGHGLVWNAVPTLRLKGIKEMLPMQVLSEHNYSVTRGPQKTNPNVYKSQNEILQKYTNAKLDNGTEPFVRESNSHLAGFLDTDKSVRIIKDIWDDWVDVSMYGDYEDIIVNDKQTATPEPTIDNVAEIKGDNKNLLHDGFLCNVCNVPIIGYRYTCVQCLDYDLCGACEAKGAHCLHYVLRIPSPRPFGEIKALLDIIRNKLFLPEPVSEKKNTHLVDEMKTEFIEEDIDPILLTDDYLEDNADDNAPYVLEYLDNTEHPVNDSPSVEFVDTTAYRRHKVNATSETHKERNALEHSDNLAYIGREVNPSDEFLDTSTNRPHKIKITHDKQKALNGPVRLNTIDLDQNLYDEMSSNFVDAYTRHQMSVMNKKNKETNVNKPFNNLENTNVVNKVTPNAKSVDTSVHKTHKITKVPNSYITIPASHMNTTKNVTNILKQKIKMSEISDRISKVIRTKPNAVKVISLESPSWKSKKEIEKRKLIHVITHATHLRKKQLKKEVKVNVTRLSEEELDAALKQFRNSYKS